MNRHFFSLAVAAAALLLTSGTIPEHIADFTQNVKAESEKTATAVKNKSQKQRKSEGEDTEGITVMSLNIRNSDAKDGTNSWSYRYPATFEMISKLKPDVIGFQEVLPLQKVMLNEFAEGYKSVGVGRDDGKNKGEQTCIFWNKKSVKMLKWGTFWLSETPDEPSGSWDTACQRTATWALMKDRRSGKKFYFVNTHLDHVSALARTEGLKLIVSRIEEMNSDGLPVVLTGDFNVKPQDPCLQVLDGKMRSARGCAPEPHDNGATWHNWGRKQNGLIDYIYCSGFSKCASFRRVTEKFADRPFVSDHYPIVAELVF